MFKINLEEPSTWRGVTSLLTGMAAIIGSYLSPECVELIIATGLSIAGSIGFIVPDKKQVFIIDEQPNENDQDG